MTDINTPSKVNILGPALLAVLLVCLVLPARFAAAQEAQSTNFKHVDVNLRYWFNYAESKIKARGLTNTGFEIHADQELDAMETHIGILTATWKPIWWAKVEAAYGYGVLTGGDYKFVFNDNEPADHDYGTLMGDPDDDYTLWTFAAHVRVWPWSKKEPRHWLDAYVKYQIFDQEITAAIQDRADQLNKVPLPGLLEWREDWDIIWIGVKGECGMVESPSLGAYQWGFVVDAAVSPYMEATAKGDYYMNNAIQYTQLDVEGYDGYGFMAELGVFYQPVPYFRVQVGAMYQYLKMRDGNGKVVDLNSQALRSGDFESWQVQNFGPYVQAGFRW